MTGPACLVLFRLVDCNIRIRFKGWCFSGSLISTFESDSKGGAFSGWALRGGSSESEENQRESRHWRKDSGRGKNHGHDDGFTVFVGDLCMDWWGHVHKCAQMHNKT